MEGAASAEIECALAADVCAVFDAVVSVLRNVTGTLDAFPIFHRTDVITAIG